MNENKWRNGIGILQSLLILGGLMIVGLFLSSTVMSLCGHGTLTRGAVLWGSVAQNVLAFIVPVILLPYFIGRRPGNWLNYKPRGSWVTYVGIVLMMVVSLPLMSCIIDFNASVHLPDSMSELEHTLRAMEEKGSESTQLVLANSTVFQLIISVLIVGILTGIGEEMFFRGGIQNVLTRFEVRPWVAITIAAAVFSAAHFQFFGFLPRFILGMWFGWLYWRFGSIWPAATAHAFNNAVVVVSSWMIERGTLSAEFEKFGMSGVTPVIISMVGCVVVFWGCFRRGRGGRF